MNEIKLDGKAKIIYKNNKPYGIRDNGGYLFFFSKISKFTNQEERYRREVEQQYRLADFLKKPSTPARRKMSARDKESKQTLTSTGRGNENNQRH